MKKSPYIDTRDINLEITVSQFYDQLKSFDWFYEMSDDHRVWTRGNARHEKLKYIATARGGEYKTMMDDFVAWINSRMSGNRDAEMPSKPEEK